VVLERRTMTGIPEISARGSLVLWATCLQASQTEKFTVGRPQRRANKQPPPISSQRKKNITRNPGISEFRALSTFVFPCLQAHFLFSFFDCWVKLNTTPWRCWCIPLYQEYTLQNRLPLINCSGARWNALDHTEEPRQKQQMFLFNRFFLNDLISTQIFLKRNCSKHSKNQSSTQWAG